MSEALPLIEVRGLTKHFSGRLLFGTGPVVRAVDCVSLSIRAG